MVIKLISLIVLMAALGLPCVARAADQQRIAEVAQRGPDVMPFDLKATSHIFTKTDTGGIQKVVVKDPGNSVQVDLVRRHLKDIQAQFRKGDFSGPSHIHGNQMPGLPDLKAAKLGEIVIDYKDIEGGAELTYRTSDAKLVAALHRWFNAQLSDHGADAMAGHRHHHMEMTRH